MPQWMIGLNGYVVALPFLVAAVAILVAVIWHDWRRQR